MYKFSRVISCMGIRHPRRPIGVTEVLIMYARAPLCWACLILRYMYSGPGEEASELRAQSGLRLFL
jgi:hypothetical protein